MKIGIVTNVLDKPLTGIGHYTLNLLQHLLESPQHEYHLIHFQKNSNPLYRKAAEVCYTLPSFLPETAKSGLGVRLAARRLDLVHIPSQMGFFLPVGCAKVLTIHDLTPILFPQTHTRAWVLLHRYALPRIVKRVDLVITDSENTRRDVVKYLHADEERVSTIYLAADPQKYRVLPPEEVQEVRQKYHLDFPYILYVGNLEPRKNLPALLQAFRALADQFREYRLVIVGQKAWKFHPILQSVTGLNLTDRVVFTGYVPEEDLPGIYNGARLFVFPSLYEGFGLPPLEAMMCGVPVITSRRSSLPEVVGDAAILIDPEDVGGLAQAISRVLADESLRATLIGKGREQAQRFSWDKCARETLAVYQEAYARSRSIK